MMYIYIYVYVLAAPRSAKRAAVPKRASRVARREVNCLAASSLEKTTGGYSK